MYKEFVNCRTIISPQRSKRPHQKEDIPSSGCPFCPGNEALTPEETFRIEKEGRWLTRTFPNKYPIVTPPEGTHEVIVETPKHNIQPWEMTPKELENVLKTYIHMLKTLSRKFPYICIFKNHKREAGASIVHPHSQIIALNFIPEPVKEEETKAQLFYQKHSQCPLCHLLSHHEFIVTQDKETTALCPPAPRFPFETWIIPTSHQHDFSEASIESVSQILLKTFKKLHNILGDFPFNLLVKTWNTRKPWLHWRIEILPRTTIIGGFELSSGIFVNPTPPEKSAQKMRIK